MKERKVPMRKCVGCMQSKEKQALIRIAAYEGQISVDPSGRAKGRGVYICKNSPDCREKAEKRRRTGTRVFDGDRTGDQKRNLRAAGSF